MKSRDAQTRAPEVLTGELMLAKGVIEEKNEQLDQKDLTIRTLSSRVRAMESESEELKLALSRATRREAIARAEERASAVRTVVSDIVRVAATYEDVYGRSSTGLASRIYALLEERYELRVIADPPRSVDPELHHVVEVDHCGASDGSVEILSNGYRLGDTVIRPALVKVILGVRSGGRASNEACSTDTTYGDSDE